jgi:hypothetical protein
MFFGNLPHCFPATAAASPHLLPSNRALSYSVALSAYPRNPIYSHAKPPGRLSVRKHVAPISPLDLDSWKRTTNNSHRMILLQKMTAIQPSSFPRNTASRRNHPGINTYRTFSPRKAARANRLRMIFLQNYEIKLPGMILLQKKWGGGGTQEIPSPNLPRAYNPRQPNDSEIGQR